MKSTANVDHPALTSVMMGNLPPAAVSRSVRRDASVKMDTYVTLRQEIA